MKQLLLIVFTAVFTASLLAGCGEPADTPASATAATERAGTAADETATPEASKTTATPVRVTVSGISSGAYMATQFHVAYADRVDGAGLIAGGPWGCAQGEIARALGTCVNGDDIDVAGLLASARELADAGAIPALEHLAGDRVFVFHGTLDTIVAPAVADAAAAWYRAAGASVTEVRDVATVHGWPTVAAGVGCDEFAPPYINACDYDLAGALLGTLYEDLQPPTTATGRIVEIPQDAPGSAGLADTGYAYVPPACAGDAACDVHVVFHGCGQTAGQIGTAFVEQSGFNEYAEANELVVLYPQAKPSMLAPQNPLGCWDWWGYSSSEYLEADAPQLTAIRAMIDSLL